MRRSILGFCLSAFLSPSLADASDEVVVFAAASLKTALDAVAADFEDRTGHRVSVSYAGSGKLAAQILSGAPADIFLSASSEWMDVVEQAGALADGTRRDILGNRLVLIAHGRDAPPIVIGPDLDLAALLGRDRLAMAFLEGVPAGQYGKAALIDLGLWASVEPAVAQLDNVRAVLTLVARGEAPFGIVYATDAVASDNVTVVGVFPKDTHPPIVYPAALLVHATAEPERAFFDALMSDIGSARFEEQGFILLH